MVEQINQFEPTICLDETVIQVDKENEGVFKRTTKVNLSASGFGEAPVSVSNANVYIDPPTKMQPLHSTSVMRDKEETPKKRRPKITDYFDF
ncbi:hypothetical protein CSV63_03655 [Sporosarcina sp. P34]|nr:hypothetical protein CSV63_03655 [Sporosarcina sp. P34]